MSTAYFPSYLRTATKYENKMGRFGRRTVLLSRESLLLSGAVQNFVAFPANRDQVGLQILSKSAAPPQVVNIEIFEAATCLAAPVIALQYFFAQP